MEERRSAGRCSLCALVEFGDYYYVVRVVPSSRYFPKTDYHRSPTEQHLLPVRRSLKGIPARIHSLVLRSVPQFLLNLTLSFQQQKKVS
jgi:hypothetical protein